VTQPPAAAANRRGTVAFVTANTFEFDSRHRRATAALAADGWAVVVVAMRAAHLPVDEVLENGVVVRRPPVERRILAALPRLLRRPVGALLGLDADAERLPPRGAGLPGRVRAAGRRGLEILAYRRRIAGWTAALAAAAPEARLFVAKSLVGLPVAAGAAHATGGRHVYDIADLHVESGRLAGLPRLLKRYLARREGRWLRGAAALIAVTPAMAAAVAARHGVERPVVVMNTRERWRPDEPRPRSSQLRDAAVLGPGREIVLYQGAFRPDQGIELLLEALVHPILAARPLTAVFLGFGVLEDRLRREAELQTGRLAVLPAVASEELLEWTAGADVSFVGTPPVTANQKLTTPNKLFESVMAGVPVVVAAGTWTARLVHAERLGTVVDPWTVEGLALALGALLGQPAGAREQHRRAIRRTALERFNWDVDRERLVELFRRLE